MPRKCKIQLRTLKPIPMNLVIRFVLFYLLVGEKFLGIKLDLPVVIVLPEAAKEVVVAVAMEVVVEVKILSMMLLQIHLYVILLV